MVYMICIYIYTMTSLIPSVIQTTFAAISFAGAGFLFSKLNHRGYEEEMRRHNLALEKLAESKEKFYENEIKNRDRIQRLREELSDANVDINITNKALSELHSVQSINYRGRQFSREPKLNDFYQESNEMKKYQKIFIAGLGITSGYLVSHFKLL